MTNDENNRLDPRFDPAFQRGYDGPVTPVERSSRASVTYPERTVPQAPVAQPAPTAPAQTAGQATPRESVGVPDDEPAEPRASLRNPFLVALAVVAVVLVALGLYLFQWMRQAFLDIQNSADFDYFTQQTLIFAAPLCIAVGVATGIGVLFMFASGWRGGQR